MPHNAATPITVAAAPNPSWPPPKQRPMTVTSQIVAAVVTPRTVSPRRRMAPAPMKPTPDRIPSGSRMISSRTIELWVSTE